MTGFLWVSVKMYKKLLNKRPIITIVATLASYIMISEFNKIVLSHLDGYQDDLTWALRFIWFVWVAFSGYHIGIYVIRNR